MTAYDQAAAELATVADPVERLHRAAEEAAHHQALAAAYLTQRDIALAHINAGEGTERLSYGQIADYFRGLLATPGRPRMTRAGVQRAVERGRAAMTP